MPSKAAEQVKQGFWIGAGIWVFLVILSIFLLLVLKAVTE